MTDGEMQALMLAQAEWEKDQLTKKIAEDNAFIASVQRLLDQGYGRTAAEVAARKQAIIDNTAKLVAVQKKIDDMHKPVLPG